jgi:hypothetical protein
MTQENKIAKELREAVKTMRRTPTPLEDFTPLIQKAADELDRLEDFEWMYRHLCD